MTKQYTWADIGHVQLTGEAMVEIANTILAEREAWAKALGVPEVSKSRPSPSPRRRPSAWLRLPS